jgi:hypothetical protein
VSRKSFAVKGQNGSSCIGMLIRSRTMSAWSKRLRLVGATNAEKKGHPPAVPYSWLIGELSKVCVAQR